MSEGPDKQPVMSVCRACGEDIHYTPIRMPAGAPVVNPANPGHFYVEYVDMCVDCVESELTALRAKILAGEMYPLQTWEWDEDHKKFQVVPISKLPPPSEEKVGWIRRFIRWLW